MRRSTLSLAAFGIAIALAACGSSDDTGPLAQREAPRLGVYTPEPARTEACCYYTNTGLAGKVQFNHEWTRIDTNEIEFGCRIGSEHQTVMHTIGLKAFFRLL